MYYLDRYQRFVEWIVAHSGGSDKFAHMCAGLAIWLISALLLRKSTFNPMPFMIVVAAEITNECLDRISHDSWNWPDTSTDIAATLFWPAVIMLLQRSVPFLSRKHPRKVRSSARYQKK